MKNPVKKFIDEHPIEVGLGIVTVSSIGLGAVIGYVAGYNYHMNVFKKYIPDILKESMEMGSGAFEDIIRDRIPKVDDLIEAYDLINPGEIGDLLEKVFEHDVTNLLIEAGVK